jgi:hypothetical protein
LAYDIGPDLVLKFWMLTPEEFAVHADCYYRRLAREADRSAILLCNLRAVILGKKRVKPSDILGRPLLSAQRKRQRATRPVED